MIKFVSYTGSYPNLCSGVLTVEIEGKEYKFGHQSGSYDFENNRYTDDNFDCFWVSGGCVRGNEQWELWAEQGEWKLCDLSWNKVDERHPDWVKPLLSELIELFNNNVSYGCCGGCI